MTVQWIRNLSRFFAGVSSVILTVLMALNSATSTSLTSSGNRGNEERGEGPFRGSFDEDFVLLTFLLLFGIGTVVIGPGGVNWPRF